MTEKEPEQEKEVVIGDTAIPIKSPEVTIREEMEEDGKYILYNGENELILVINPTGKFILDSCNGKKTVAQISKEIEKNFTVKEDMDLPSVTKAFLSTLLKAELISLKEGVK